MLQMLQMQILVFAIFVFSDFCYRSIILAYA